MKTIIKMKKQLLLLVMMLLPVVANANIVEIDGIYYYLMEDGKQAMLVSSPTNPNYYVGSVVIPETVNYEGTRKSGTVLNDPLLSRNILSY